MKKIKTKVHYLTGLFVVMALLVFSPAASWALLSDYIDFNMDATHPAGAGISYAGGAAPLIGANIGVDNVTGYLTGGVLSVPTVPIVGGILSFTTGNIVSSAPNSWLFSGGSISINGFVPAIPGSTPFLLTGNLGEVTVQQVGSEGFKIALGSFTDFKDLLLAQYFFGAIFPGYAGGMNLSFLTAGAVGAGDAFSSTSVLSGDVVNAPVPLPGAVWLLGTGIVGLVGVRRRLRG